ncbi:probable histone-lysine N-methyltransferase PRDM7 [Otolemur garnettii]|uniref:probable histone-lysine N-methyltransferase PRDM7 n=1 Tax=Otolemur garnettii TaxID=30611 RepID=UPI000C7EBE25|nr:probable histone-lysine N-methyltransferase PRDM7 [Otolemur garnettii]
MPEVECLPNPIDKKVFHRNPNTDCEKCQNSFIDNSAVHGPPTFVKYTAMHKITKGRNCYEYVDEKDESQSNWMSRTKARDSSMSIMLSGLLHSEIPQSTCRMHALLSDLPGNIWKKIPPTRHSLPQG